MTKQSRTIFFRIIDIIQILLIGIVLKGIEMYLSGNLVIEITIYQLLSEGHYSREIFLGFVYGAWWFQK